jgi:beta-glucosidase
MDIKTKARELVAQMTLEEKVSQMLHSAPAIPRLNIPAYNWWNEALHGVARAGVATMFPQAIALAATFDTQLVQKVADVVSTEGRAKFSAQQEEGDRDIYKGITFWSPNINIFRDPRWGRGHETYGEDPYLTSQLGLAFIKGLQGPERDSLKTAACAKHFAVHSGPENDRHHFNAVVDKYDLWNTYLAAFEVAVKEGQVEAVMGAYNRTLGEPCCGSKLLLHDILRDKWGFDGHVVSDCWAIRNFHETHHVTESPVESVALAVKNGCDVNCGNLFGLAVEAVQKGLLHEEAIDAAVTRLLTTRMRLGLLGADENKAYTNIPFEEVDSPEHSKFNLAVARRSLVLLKNDGALPFRGWMKLDTIGVIGPNADSQVALEGNYQGTASQHTTVLEAIRRRVWFRNSRVMYAQGCHLVRDRSESLAQEDDRLAEARIVTKHSDAVVVVLGLDSSIEGEENDQYSESIGGDKPFIELPGRQQKLLETVVDAAKGKPVILVVMSGSALALGWAADNVNGIVQAFYPGAKGGEAIVDLLFGDFSPSGKLPVTFYRGTSDLPAFTDYNMANRTYRYYKGEPLYPFGFGLSYSTFLLSDPKANKKTLTVTIKNTGIIDAWETVQVYVTSPGTREIRSLCGVASVYIVAWREETVVVKLNKNAFSRYDENGDPHEIKGTHTLSVGFTQGDELSARLYGQASLSVELEI